MKGEHGTIGDLIPRGANKTSIAFKVRNVPGALFKSLSVFALRDISLSKIESRPMRGRPWEYVFYVDFLRGDDEPARNALRHLGEVAEFVKVLAFTFQRNLKTGSAKLASHRLVTLHTESRTFRRALRLRCAAVIRSAGTEINLGRVYVISPCDGDFCVRTGSNLDCSSKRK